MTEASRIADALERIAAALEEQSAEGVRRKRRPDPERAPATARDVEDVSAILRRKGKLPGQGGSR